MNVEESLSKLKTALKQNPELVDHAAMQDFLDYALSLRANNDDGEVSEGVPDCFEEVGTVAGSSQIDEITKLIEDEATSRKFCDRATKYMEMNRLEDALSDVKRAIDINPDYARAYRIRSEAFWQKDHFESAYRSMCEAQRLDYNEEYDALHDQMRVAYENSERRCPPPPESGFAGMQFDPSALSSMMKNPQLMSMAQSMMQNPEFMKNMLESMAPKPS